MLTQTLKCNSGQEYTMLHDLHYTETLHQLHYNVILQLTTAFIRLWRSLAGKTFNYAGRLLKSVNKA